MDESKEHREDGSAPERREQRHAGDRRSAAERAADGDEPGRRRGADRRAAERVPLEMWMEEVEKGHVALRRTGDVSAGGAYFERIVPHPLGTRIALRIPLPGQEQEVRVFGEVVNLEKDGTGMGVKFTEFDGDGEQRLRDFLDSAMK